MISATYFYQPLLDGITKCLEKERATLEMKGVDISRICMQHPSLGTKTDSRLCGLNQVAPPSLQT